MERNKMVLVSSLGGMLCSALALLLAPHFIWLGAMASFAVIYLGYEFKETRAAVPVALKNTKESLSEKYSRVLHYIRTPHPFGYLSILIGIVGSTWFCAKIENSEISWAYWATLHIAIFLIFAGITSLILLFSMVLGGGENYTSNPDLVTENNPLLTYKNFFMWTGKGVARMGKFLFWDFWKGLFTITGVILAILFLTLLAIIVGVPILIYSEKRIACVVHTVVGGLLSYIYLSHLGNPALVILAGGLISGALTLMGRHLISKRILKVQ